MSSFSLTPLGTFPPPAPQDFPVGVQWQQDGTNLGDRTVDTINVTGGLEATRGTGETANVLTVVGDGSASSLTWRDVGADTTIAAEDAGNGISTSGNTGDQIVTVADVLADGEMVLIYQAGAAPVSVVPASGVTLNIRSGLTDTLAGQYATATLIKRSAGNYILCGDLATP